MAALKEFDLPFAGTTMHCWEGGDGLPIIFMHGSGPGAQTSSNFKRVMPALSQRYRVLATDLIGFGQSGMRPSGPAFDVGMWVQQLETLIRERTAGPVALIGHSLSASFVLTVAASNSNVVGVIGTAPFGISYNVGANAGGWKLPTSREALRAQVQSTVFDVSFIDEAELDLRWSTLTRPGYGEYFQDMFPHGRQFYVDAAAVKKEDLAQIHCPVLFMHGANDRSFGPEHTSLPLAKRIRRADVFILNECGHSVALEHPLKFMAMVDLYFGGLPEAA